MAVKKIRRYRAVTILTVIALVLNLFFFLLLPLIAARVITGRVAREINREITVGRVRINPYRLSVGVETLFVREPGGERLFFFCRELYLQFNASTLFRRAPVIGRLRIRDPYLSLVREKEHAYNFSDLLAREAPADPGPGSRFFVGNITLENGRIVFDDRPVGKTHLVRAMNVALPFISNFPAFVDIFTDPEFSAEINGASFAFEGESRPFSDAVETNLEISLDNLSLPGYVAYLPSPPGFRLESARLGGEISFSHVQPAREAPSLVVRAELVLADLEINDTGGRPMLRIPETTVRLEALDVFARRASLGAVNLVAPEITVLRDGGGSVNLAGALPAGGGGNESSPGEASAPFLFDLASISLTDGRVSFTDEAPGTVFEALLEPVGLEVTGLSNRAGSSARYRLSAASRAGETISLEGDFGLVPLFAAGSVELENLPAGNYAPYYERAVSFGVESGRLSVGGNWRYAQEGPELVFSGLYAILSDLALAADAGGNFLEIEKLDLRGGQLDAMQRSASASACRVEGMRLAGERGPDGALDFLPLVARADPGETGEGGPPGGAEGAWSVSLDSLELARGLVSFRDNLPSGRAEIDLADLSLRASDLLLGSDRESPLEIAFLLDGRGAVSGEGVLRQAPFFLELDLDASDLSLAPARPYLARALDAVLEEGRLNARGVLSAGTDREGRPATGFRGEASLVDFRVTDAENREPLLGLGNLALQDLVFGQDPPLFSVREALVRDLRANIVFSPQRELNFLRALRRGEGTPAGGGDEPVPGGEAAPAWKTHVGRVVFRDGAFTFLDRGIEPNYSLSVSDFSGSVTGLSSLEEEPAELDFSALVEGDAAFSARGRVQPLARDLFLDIRVDIGGLDLVSASPYSGRYLGYKVFRGRSFFNFEYEIENRRLNSRNTVIFDQLALGDRVESPDATRLPVRFAIALLRDTAGRIRINLPVSGSLDDPEFRIAPLVIQTLVNLIARAAASPFSFLASVFGRGEELRFLEFEYGSAEISLPEAEKLETIITILNQRPALSLEIAGVFDRRRDADALRAKALEANLLGRLREEVAAPDGVAVDTPVLEPGGDDHRRLLLAFLAESAPPDQPLELDELPLSGLESLALEKIEVSASDLRFLAIARAQAARDRLLGAGISGDRVFLLEPGTGVHGDEPDLVLKSSRVDFQLK